MKILIPTLTQDIHAKVVARALRQDGHEVTLWYGSDLPSQQTVSLEIDGGTSTLDLAGRELSAQGPFDVVWLRRPADAVLPEDMHPGDREFAEREWYRFARALWKTVGRDAFWVNPLEGAARATSKTRQLLDAAAVGLSTPRTLCSNDPERIRAFIRESPAQTIYKPFCTGQWRTEEGSAFLFTAVVTDADLPPDDVLRLCPGIFQPRVEKSHELRITAMGDRLFAVRLESQSLDLARVDWRAGTRNIDMKVVELDPDVEKRCRALMRRLGLVFGCLDFIVTPSGEHVFLEVNEMGQFLWLEELLPELPLLDAFCAMLTQRRPDFEWDPATAARSFSSLHDPEREAKADAQHTRHPQRYVMDDRTRVAPSPSA
ncbi:MAG: hypothetical protein ACRBN8_21700 [Nannocystales bacterium]